MALDAKCDQLRCGDLATNYVQVIWSAKVPGGTQTDYYYGYYCDEHTESQPAVGEVINPGKRTVLEVDKRKLPK